mmetsp:Transcript_9542/g.15895  ORF Transcript_9542/g.15895 Transcript_9542/m.15895 type:complete len:891 (-) Transcript_9542:57-2729(-)|eukprot:CAMPEP_0119029622 /NCGR_PEP_ID=MMETSP1176-20130426/40612_1 /TAXON_ID=265551 /ORGANISM="Synedropsis recta cf, Strain CCMP1620" /LENGTH=890 /DNA_ID=CAMNT_0006985971 /DNA_START=29 /DNA_END=2701 /DNA_ORIENTATION=+
MKWTDNDANQASIIFENSFGANLVLDHDDDQQQHHPAITSSSSSPPRSAKKPLPSSGLSELSKQLRNLQSTNHDQAAQIDKLDRKLKIMSDLKGVSVHDIKSALLDACQGEAFNELRAEVETLRAQLDIAAMSSKFSSSSSRNHQPPSIEQKSAIANLANMELRVGELEEIEESLRAEISKLYETLRDQDAKAAQLESSNETYQRQMDDWETKYDDMKQKLNSDNEAAIASLQSEVESSRVVEAEVYLRRQKELVEALRIQVAEYQGLELQLTQQKNKIKELHETLDRQDSESRSTLKTEVNAVKARLVNTKNRALDAESKLQAANETIRDLEQQVAKIFSLELVIAKQKVKLKQLAEQTAVSSQRTMEVHKVESSTARVEMDRLQKLAVGAVEAKLQAALAKSTVLQKEVVRLAELEQQLAEQEEELSAQRKKIDRYRKEREKASRAQKVSSKKDADAYENRILELQDELSKWRDRVSELDEQICDIDDLKAKYKKQTKEVEKLTRDRVKLSKEEQKQRKENEDGKAEISRLTDKVQATEMQLKVEQAKADSLQKQIKSTENEAKLRKKQFKSRFKIQDERIEDLEQQLSSLYTAFNMERGERTEEIKTQAVLQMSLGEADTKVAHQLHNIEEEKQTPTSPGTPGSPVSPVTPASSLRTSYNPYQSPVTPQKNQPSQIGEVGIAQGYLFKRDKFKGWKKRYCFLHGDLSGGTFTVDYSDGPNKTTKGFISGIQTSQSRVQLSKEFPKQPFAFVLRVNPYDNKSPTVYFAAENQSELNLWVSAFAMVTQGIKTETVSSSVSMSYPVGSRVVIVDLVNHPEYNGLSGLITSPLDNYRQCVTIEALKQKVKLSPANLELFALPDEAQAMYNNHGGGDSNSGSTAELAARYAV